MREIKTYENWPGNGNLDVYLQPGDLVDEEMVGYFRDILPPRVCDSNLIQIGEAANYVRGKATYSTLKRTEEGWEYCGECYAGETVEAREE